MQWDVRLNDRGSEVYQSLSKQIAKNIATIFATFPDPSVKGDLAVKVVKFSSDIGVTVTAALWWNSKQEMNLTSPTDVMEKLVNSIRKDNGKLHNHFDVDQNSVTVSRVIKNCRTLGCKTVDCDFSHVELRFFCLCEEETINKVDCVLKNSTKPLESDAAEILHQRVVDLANKTLPSANKKVPEISFQPSVKQTSSSTDDSFEPDIFETNDDIADGNKFHSLDEFDYGTEEATEGSGMKQLEQQGMNGILHKESERNSLEDEWFLVEREENISSHEGDAETFTTMSPVEDFYDPETCLRQLDRHQLCDNLEDCADGSDEALCEFGGCQQNEFPCLSGRCIPEAWKCDGRPDCDSGEDEVACAASCPPGQWLCREGRCIEAALLCDGVRDCGLGEDEDPGLCNCGEDELRCETGGGCVQAGARCDGRLQCPDRSDEWNCVSLVNNTLEIRSAIKINKRFRKVILKLTELSRVNRTSASPSPRPVCIDQWSDEWSEQACRQLGYSGQRSSSSRYDFTLSDSEFWYRDVSVPVSGNPVQKAAATEGRCRSKETVQLECEEFGKPTLSTLFIL